MKLVFIIAGCIFTTLGSCLDSGFETTDRFTEPRDDVQTLAKEVRAMASVLAEVMRWKEEVEQNRKEEIVPSGKENERLNDTIEERVTVLEFQVAGLEDDVTTINVDIADLGEDLDLVEGEVAVISAGQVLQDERILELEVDSDSTMDSVTALETANEELNSAVTTVDDRVTTLNGTLSQVEDTVSNHDASLTELDNRVEQMEVSGTVAFQADLDEYTSIPIDSVMIFGEVMLNLGNGYNSETGEFTVPSGGAGLYFFYVNFLSDIQEYASFLVRINGNILCRVYVDINTSGAGDRANPSCGGVTTLAEGDVVHVYYTDGTDDSPVANNSAQDNIFTGFRIAPE